MGDSQGGYWVPRDSHSSTASRAGIADPGVWDVSTSWGLNKLPPPLPRLFSSGNKTAFDQAMHVGLASDPAGAATLAFRSRPYGFDSVFDTYTAVQQYALTSDIVSQITCPMLVADPEGEQFWPGQSREAEPGTPRLPAARSFTRAEGADLHCEPKAPGCGPSACSTGWTLRSPQPESARFRSPKDCRMRNLVWSFAPWFVFLIAAHIATLEFAIAAGVVAAVIVYGRAVVDDRVYLLDVAGVIYFLGLGVALLVDPVIVNDWGPYAQLDRTRCSP